MCLCFSGFAVIFGCLNVFDFIDNYKNNEFYTFIVVQCSAMGITFQITFVYIIQCISINLCTELSLSFYEKYEKYPLISKLIYYTICCCFVIIVIILKYPNLENSQSQSISESIKKEIKIVIE